MSVYKLELEKASIIIKKETIINPPPVIETVDIPNGTTFGRSNFETNPEAIYLLSNYINTGTYNGSLFYYATFPESSLGSLSITTPSLVEIMVLSLLIEPARELICFSKRISR